MSERAVRRSETIYAELRTAADFFSRPYPTPEQTRHAQSVLARIGSGELRALLLLLFPRASSSQQPHCVSLVDPKDVTIGDGTVGTENRLLSIFEQYPAKVPTSIHTGTRAVNRLISQTELPPELPEDEFNLIRGLVAIAALPDARITNGEIAVCGVQKQGLAMADPELVTTIAELQQAYE